MTLNALNRTLLTKNTGGTVNEQLPAIRFKGKYWSLSLRMMKAIYRHIRLKKGFVNVEEVDGICKLKIPTMLMQEKIRTQTRFEVCFPWALLTGFVHHAERRDMP